MSEPIEQTEAPAVVEVAGDEEIWGVSVAERNEDGLRGGAAAPEGHGGPFPDDRG